MSSNEEPEADVVVHVGCGDASRTEHLWNLPGYLRTLAEFKSQDPWVSRRSHFTSDVWHIDLPQPAGKLTARMDFRDVAPDLAAELKIAVIASVVHPGLRRSALETAADYGLALITVGGWMTHVGFTSISDLGDGAGELFLQAVAEFISQLDDESLSANRGDWDPRRRNGDRKAQPYRGGEPSVTFVLLMAKALLKLHADGNVLAQLAGVRVSGFPFKRTNAGHIAQEWGETAEEAVERLPDPVLKIVIDGARRMMGTPADDVIRLVGRFLKLIRAGLSPEEAAVRLREFRFGRVPGETKAWRGTLIPKGVAPFDAIKALVHQIRDAGIILVQLGVGNRPSEALGLMGGVSPRPLVRPGGGGGGGGGGGSGGTRVARTLPRCVTEVSSKSGLSVEILLHGHVFKGRRVPQPVSWLLGSRHDGGPDPYSLQALCVLERLFAPLRDFGPAEDRDWLIIDFASVVDGVFAMQAMSVGRLGQQMKYSITRFVDMSGLPDKYEGRDLRRYRDSNGYCIALYQCRKTYAQVAYRIDPNLMPAITRQLQNGSSDRTKTSYVTDDPQFRRELEIDRSHHTVLLMQRVMDGVVRTEGTMAGVIDRMMRGVEAGTAGELNDTFWQVRVERDDRVFGQGSLRPRAGVRNILAELRGPRDVIGTERPPVSADPDAAGRDGPALLRRLVSDRRRWMEDLAAGFGALGLPARELAVEAGRRLSAMGFAVPEWPDRDGEDR